jgi:hypothetical protein
MLTCAYAENRTAQVSLVQFVGTRLYTCFSLVAHADAGGNRGLAV